MLSRENHMVISNQNGEQTLAKWSSCGTYSSTALKMILLLMSALAQDHELWVSARTVFFCKATPIYSVF